MLVEAAIRAIAEPHRREILRLVWTTELAAGEIASHFAVTRPAISQHLRVLKEAGLVSERPVGTSGGCRGVTLLTLAVALPALLLAVTNTS